MKTVSIIGGDLRFITLCRMMKEKGYEITAYGFDKIDTAKNLQQALQSEVIILPIPVSADGKNINAPLFDGKIPIDDFFSEIGGGKLVLAGHISNLLAKRFDDEGIVCIDYYNREELMIKNAIPTAEGAVEIAISKMPTTLFSSNALVAGYGRIGKILSKLLQNMGAVVSVSARKMADFAQIEANGMIPVKTKDIAKFADRYDVIFNTVPSVVIGEDVLEKIDDKTPVIDLASLPGGVDVEAAKSLKKQIIPALSLPGKTAPVTAGKIICETVCNILNELEVQ